MPTAYRIFLNVTKKKKTMEQLTRIQITDYFVWYLYLQLNKIFLCEVQKFFLLFITRVIFKYLSKYLVTLVFHKYFVRTKKVLLYLQNTFVINYKVLFYYSTYNVLFYFHNMFVLPKYYLLFYLQSTFLLPKYFCTHSSTNHVLFYSQTTSLLTMYYSNYKVVFYIQRSFVLPKYF